MSTTTRRPSVYRPSKLERLVEGLRYGGGVGQWSWLLHRLTGVGILAFLVIHIVDTFLVVAYPAEYDFTVAIYGGVFNERYYWPLRWAFRLGELGLIFSVVFHAINGVRIVLFDFWPPAARYQHQLFQGVVVVCLAIMVPVTAWVIYPLFSAPAHVTVPVPVIGEGGTLAPAGAGGGR